MQALRARKPEYASMHGRIRSTIEFSNFAFRNVSFGGRHDVRNVGQRGRYGRANRCRAIVATASKLPRKYLHAPKFLRRRMSAFCGIVRSPWA